MKGDGKGLRLFSFFIMKKTTLNMIGAITGIFSVAGLSAWSALKLKKELDDKKTTKEIILRSWWPIALTGLSISSTIYSIYSLNKNHKQITSNVISSYMMLSEIYHKHREEIKNRFGEEMLRDIDIEVSHPAYIVNKNGVVVDGVSVDSDETILFYDEFANRYFTSTIFHVIQAAYHLNRNINLNGHVFLKEYYSFLGLDTPDDLYLYGWDINENYSGGIYWLDIYTYKTQLEDGLWCYTVGCPFDPIILDYI